MHATHLFLDKHRKIEHNLLIYLLKVDVGTRLVCLSRSMYAVMNERTREARRQTRRESKPNYIPLFHPIDKRTRTM